MEGESVKVPLKTIVTNMYTCFLVIAWMLWLLFKWTSNEQQLNLVYHWIYTNLPLIACTEPSNQPTIEDCYI